MRVERPLGAADGRRRMLVALQLAQDQAQAPCLLRIRAPSARPAPARRQISRETVAGQSSTGETTRYRSGSSPSLCVSTPPRSRRYSWTIRRSDGGIGSSSTGRPVAQRLLGRVVRVGPQQLRPALAVAIGVDHHAHRRRAVGEHDPLRQMLHGVDRLSAPADEQAHVLTLDAAAQHALVLLNLNLNLEPEPLGDLLEQLLQQLGRLELLLAEVLRARVQASSLIGACPSVSSSCAAAAAAAQPVCLGLWRRAAPRAGGPAQEATARARAAAARAAGHAGARERRLQSSRGLPVGGTLASTGAGGGPYGV